MAIICSHCGSALPTTSASEPTHWHNGMGQVLTAAQKDAQDKVVASRFDQPLYAHPAPSEPVSDGLVRFDGVTMTPAAAANRFSELEHRLTGGDPEERTLEHTCRSLMTKIANRGHSGLDVGCLLCQAYIAADRLLSFETGAPLSDEVTSWDRRRDSLPQPPEAK